MDLDLSSPPFDVLPSPPYRPAFGSLVSAAGVLLMAAGLVCVPVATWGVSEGDMIAVPLTFGALALGALLIARGRRLRVPPAAELLRRDCRPPVLFLRSFDDEDLIDPTPRMVPLGDFFARSYEESLVNGLSAVGPMVSIGRPGDRLARLGGGRLFVPDHAWRAAVDYLRQRAATVVLMVGRSEGVWWEITSCLQSVPHARLLFFFPYVEDAAKRRSRWRRLLFFRAAAIPLWSRPYRRMQREREARYALFRERVQPQLSGRLPDTLGRSVFIDFLPDGTPRALPTVRPAWWPLALLTPSMRQTIVNSSASLRPFVEKVRQAS